MKLANLSVRRPVTVTIVVCIALLLGFVSFSRLRVDLLPEIDFAVAVVATTYEGAGPHEVESLVSRPIEEVMTTVGNVKNVSSTSTRGQSLVLVEFNWGTDMNFATLEMREKIDQIRPFLPDGAGDPRVMKFDPTSAPVMQIAMSGNRDAAALKEIAEEIVKNRLERLEGVASVRIVGGQDREVHVTLDPALMTTLGITFSHVTQALQAANLNLPGGRIETADREVTIRTTGEFENLDDLERVKISTPAGGVTLGEIARISMGYSDVDQLTRMNSRPSIGLDVLKETDANSVQVARLVRQAIEELSKELGDDVAFVTIADESVFIERSIGSVSENALVGGLLAILILLYFLRSPRTTGIIAVAIPVSIIFTFVLVYFSGMSLNMMSLGGLALGVGMMVDNSIVVLENIFRRRQLGEEAVDAAVNGASEVGMAIVASTLTTVAIFLPVVFVEGLASQIFSDLAFTISFSLVASLIVSMSVVPALASRILSGVKTQGAGSAGGLARDPLRRLAGWYTAFLRRILHKRGWIFLTLAVATAATLVVAPRIGQEFLPTFDEGQIQIDVELPKGSRLDETDRVVAEVERLLQTIPGVQSVFAQSGVEGAADAGILVVQLVPVSQRRADTGAYVEAIRTRLAGVEGAEIRVAPMSAITGGLSTAPIQVEIRGDDLDELNRVAAIVADRVRSVPGTRDVSLSTEEARPEVQVRIDRERAGRLDLAVAEVAAAVRTAIEGTSATVYRAGGEEIDVVVRLDPSALRSLEDLHAIPIGTPYGLVPLGEVAQLVEADSPVSIDRTGQSRAVSVRAHLADRPLGDVMNDIRARVDELELPPGTTVEYTGETEQMMEAFGNLGFALILGVVLVYGVMASQFESFAQPFTILLTVPFGLIGVVWSLLATGYTLNVVAYVGVIMMAGIVVNNAIVLVDYVNQLRARGMERDDALIEAGKTRLRPILMTTLTTVLGMAPLALGTGEGSEVQAPMAVVVIAGLSLSTLLSLLVIPTLYSVMDDFSQWVRRVVSFGKAKGVSA